MTSLFNESVCPQCGKTFVMSAPTQWKYKIYLNNKQLVLCSWSCLQKIRKAKEGTNGKHKDQG